MNQWRYPASSGGEIQAYGWQGQGEPRAIVQFVHGIAEHAARYDEFAQALCAKGIWVVAEDHMGHGGSMGETAGYFSGGWLAAVQDIYALQQATSQAHPGVPYFLYGHSMGSFLTRTFLIEHPDCPLQGAIIAGTGWQSPVALRLGLAICRREARRLGEKAVSPLVNRLMFGSYNKGIPAPKSTFAWLSRDDAAVAAYEADPLCGFDATVGLARDMLGGLQMIQNKHNLAKMNQALPVFFLAGDRDPVGHYGKGVEMACVAFRRSGMQQVDMQLYPGGRHEMHNEINKDAVYQAVIDWIYAKL